MTDNLSLVDIVYSKPVPCSCVVSCGFLSAVLRKGRDYSIIIGVFLQHNTTVSCPKRLYFLRMGLLKGWTHIKKYTHVCPAVTVGLCEFDIALYYSR